MSEKGRYAVVVVVRKQVDGFIDYPDSVATNINKVVDLKDHPQKEEVQIDWFYDEKTNTFCEDGEISYPEPEYTEETPSVEERLQAEMDYIKMKLNHR